MDKYTVLSGYSRQVNTFQEKYVLINAILIIRIVTYTLVVETRVLLPLKSHSLHKAFKSRSKDEMS